MTRYDILLVGRTPVAAVIAAKLAAAGRSVALVDDGLSPRTTRSVRWASLRELSLAEHPEIETWPAIRSFQERILVDEGSLDATYRSDRLGDLASRFLVADSTQLIEAIVGSSGSIDAGVATPAAYLFERGAVTGVRFADDSELEATLTIVTSGNRQLLGVRDQTFAVETADEVFQQIEVTWPMAPDAECSRTRIVGGPLADVDCLVSLLSLPARLVLSFVVSTAALVREAVVVTDVLSRFLAHPSVAEIPDLANASSATVRLLTMPDHVNLGRFGAGYMVLGATDGLSDPNAFDRELRLAVAFGNELSKAPVDRIGSVSLLTTIAASVRSSQWARRRPAGIPSSADVGSLLDDPDLLGPALARMARSLEVD